LIRLKRVYDPPEPDDGVRFLVDGMWPRGIKKEVLPMKDWLKEVAPSAKLRRWFGHDPDKWAEFQQRYQAELATKPDAVQPIREAAHQGNVTLLYSAQDTKHNNAVALLELRKENINRVCCL
jgi:uncharacterized protein YeaO (DUF488 family)